MQVVYYAKVYTTQIALDIFKNRKNRHTKPYDLTGTYLFLASNTSRAITRQTLIVDGGFAQT